MLSTITAKITKQVTVTFPEITPEKAEQIDYGLYMAISDILKVSALLIVSLFLSLTSQVAVAIFTLGMLRVFLGGVHSKTQLGCVISYFAFIYGSVGLSNLIEAKFLNIPLFTTSFVLAYLYAPADLPCKPIVSKRHRHKLRVYGFVTLFVFLIISFFVSERYSAIISINTLFVCIMLTPIVYKITKNRLSKGGVSSEK